MSALRIALVASLAAAGAAFAHHSPAAFDMRAEVIIAGVVSNYEWKNPHGFITVETTAPDGTRALQEIEMGPGSVLEPMGVGRDALAVGEEVTVRARPNRRGSGRIVLGVELTKADGTVIPLHLSGRRGPAPTASVAAAGVAGRWLGRSEDMFALRDGIPTWPLTDAGRAALEAVGERRTTPWSDCIAPGPPAAIVEPVLTTIEVGVEEVVIDTDLLGTASRRVARLGAEHPDELSPSLLGHSVGRWDGETLVVDTVGFLAHTEGFGFGLPSSADKHIVERFALSEDGLRLIYETTAEDPVYLAEAVTFTAQLDHRPELESIAAACDLEAARRHLEE